MDDTQAYLMERGGGYIPCFSPRSRWQSPLEKNKIYCSPHLLLNQAFYCGSGVFHKDGAIKPLVSLYNNNLGATRRELNCEKDAATACSRSRHARAPLAASHINPLWPRSTAKIESVWFFPEGGKPDGLENPSGTAENQGTTQLTLWPRPGIEPGSLGERRALYAHANQATLYYLVMTGLVAGWWLLMNRAWILSEVPNKVVHMSNNLMLTCNILSDWEKK